MLYREITDFYRHMAYAQFCFEMAGVEPDFGWAAGCLERLGEPNAEMSRKAAIIAQTMAMCADEWRAERTRLTERQVALVTSEVDFGWALEDLSWSPGR